MKHLPDKLLNEQCEFEGRLEPLVKNLTNVVCGSYSLAFIENLTTNTEIQPPNTKLCDNTVGRMQWVWTAGIVSWSLDNLFAINDNVLFYYLCYVILY